MITGAAGGAVVGAALTVLGKVVAGTSPATSANHAWNMVVFGTVAAAVIPVIMCVLDLSAEADAEVQPTMTRIRAAVASMGPPRNCAALLAGRTVETFT